MNIGAAMLQIYCKDTYRFPLYLYSSADSPDMLQQGRRPNLAEWLLP